MICRICSNSVTLTVETKDSLTREGFTCKGDPTAGLVWDDGDDVEIAGFLTDDTNPCRLGVPLHQCDGYFEKRCDPFVCSCGNNDGNDGHDDTTRKLSPGTLFRLIDEDVLEGPNKFPGN